MMTPWHHGMAWHGIMGPLGCFYQFCRIPLDYVEATPLLRYNSDWDLGVKSPLVNFLLGPMPQRWNRYFKFNSGQETNKCSNITKTVLTFTVWVITNMKVSAFLLSQDARKSILNRKLWPFPFLSTIVLAVVTNHWLEPNYKSWALGLANDAFKQNNDA